MAPFYIKIAVSLLMLLAAFVGELMHGLPRLLGLMNVDRENVIPTALGLINLSLAENYMEFSLRR